MLKLTPFAAALAVALPASAIAAPVMWSPEYTTQVCEAWNNTPTLTNELGDKWMKNDKGRGFKIVQVYRTDCGETTKTELKIVPKDGKAHCAYGGPVQTTNLDSSADYVMHAKTEKWQEMGKGEYGPMKAMALGRLKFAGPYMEAMSVMGPFEAFLLLPGKVAYDASSCPAK